MGRGKENPETQRVMGLCVISRPMTCLGHLLCRGFVPGPLGAMMHKACLAVFKLLAVSDPSLHRQAVKDMAPQCKTFLPFSAAWRALGTVGIYLQLLMGGPNCQAP